MTKQLQARAMFFIALEKAKSIADVTERAVIVAKARQDYIDVLNEGAAEPQMKEANAAGVDQALADYGLRSSST